MDVVFQWLESLYTHPMFQSGLRAALIFFFGILLARLLPRRITWSAIPAKKLFVVRKVVRYGLLALTGAWLMKELGFNLGVLLGAAGIFTVAIGFASQTSASNLISGLFLMTEQPFGVGDIIRVSDLIGEVLSIDALSVKLRTFDNLFVRVPNETMLKSNVTNLTRFPIRRIDLQIGVAYKESLEKVRELLMNVADDNPLCMEEPKPLVILLGYGESSVNIQFSIWVTREKFLDLRNAMYEEIKRVFDENGVEIPFPHRTLYTGAETAPLPVRVVTGTAQSRSASAPR